MKLKQSKLYRALGFKRRPGYIMGGCALALNTLLVTPLALAQNNEESTLGIEEIVVTARFKEENLQETPIAITAITGDMLENQNITSIADLGLIIPNANIRATGGNSGPDARIGMRGVGQDDFMVTFEPGVAIYVDDIYHGTLTGSTMDLVDLERVEVLRGPQGTLFGKNSLGGAIRMISKAPQGDDTGHIQLVVGDLNRLDLNASYDFSIIEDRLFMRVSGSSKEIEGYQTRLDYTCQMLANGTPELAGTLPQKSVSHDTTTGNCEVGKKGGSQSDSGRIMLRFLPSDKLSFDLSADYSKTVAEPGVDSLLKGSDSTGYFDGQVQATIIDPTWNTNGGSLSILGDAFVTGDPYTTYSSFNDPIKGRVWSDDQLNENWNVSARMNFEISESMNLKAIYGYRTYETYWNNGDQTPFSFNNYTVNQYHDQTSFEVQLSGVAFDERLEWTTGAYYFDSSDHLGGYVTFGTFGLILNFADFDQNDSFTSESKSIFAHTVFALTDNMSITTGLRHTSEDKTYSFDHTGFLTLSEPLEYGEGHLDWKLSLDYQFTDNMMAYVMASTGFRSEGANPRPWNQSQLLPTPGEKILAYELGLKTDFFDNRLRVNSAVFVNDYDPRLTDSLVAQCTDPNGTDPGYPYVLDGGNCPAGTFAEGTTGTFWFYYSSAPGRGEGVEIEVTANPIENLAINATYGYYKYTSDQEAGTVGYIDPSASPESPYNFNVGAQYTFHLSSGATIVPRIDWFHQGERTNGDASQPRISPWHDVPSYNLVNGRITYTSEDNGWNASLEVQNLFDEFYWIDIGPERGSDGVSTSYNRTGVPSQPRQMAVSFRRNF